jgi:para-nitrobenzyl esterase
MGMVSAPYIFRDGTVIPQDGFNTLENGTYPNKVPVLIGTNKDEYKLFMYIEKKIPFDSPLYNKTAELINKTWKYLGVDSVVHSMSVAANQPPVYVYRFDWGSQGEDGKSVLPDKQGSRIGAAHSIEIPFFMDSGNPAISLLVGSLFTDQNKEGRSKLQATMMKYLDRFVHTGNPNSDGQKNWPAWTNQPGTAKGIVFDADYHDVKLSYLNDEVTYQSILAQAQNELTGEDLAQVTKIISDWYDKR